MIARAHAAAKPSLSRKLVVLVVAAVGAATLVSTAIALWQQAGNYGAMRRQGLVSTAQIFATALAAPTAARHHREALLALRAIGRIPDLQHAEIRLADGRVLASMGSASRLTRDLSIRDGQELSVIDLMTSRSIEVAVPIVHEGEPVGELVLIGGIADLWSRLLAVLAWTLLGGGAAMLVALAVAWRLQRAITHPLRRLMLAMLAIRESHRYDVTVERASDREIGELVDGFNRMLKDVRDRDERLEAHRRNLEQEVADRTQDLRAARDAAEVANRAKSDFLATMSHEIRTPMNGIMVMADLLAAADMPRRQRRFAEVIAKSGQNLLAIINDILDFSKIEAGKLDLERLPVDLNELAENVTSLFAERARGKRLDLVALVDPAAPRRIIADPVRLGQVIGNLVNNALKFTERGSVQLTIGPPTHGGDRLEIAVADTGIGIPADKLATIFDAFAQADQSTTRQFGGTGLGLTISKRLVDAFGGDIHVHSAAGRGSTFTVAIPVSEPEWRSWPKLVPRGGSSASCLIDVAREATASALALYVGACGYRVIRQQRPTAAQCRQVSLICTDARELSGIEAAPDGSRPIVVAIRDIGDPEIAERADAVLAWPLLRSEVEDLLSRLVNGEASLQPEHAVGSRSAPVARFRRFRALVADDGAVNREVASEALRVIGATVDTVEDGAQAVQAVAASTYDIVLMDASMPEMDGFEATRRIRRIEAQTGGPRLPIVALTAHVVGAGADQWRDAGMDDVVHKPFAVGKLAQTIARLLPQFLITGEHASASTAAPMHQVVIAGLDPAIHLSGEEMDPRVKPGGDKREGDILTDATKRAGGDEEAPLLDATVLDQLHGISSAGGGLAERVLELYLAHAPAALDEIRRAMSEGAPEQCAKAAHALKSMSLSIGAERVAGQARQIELEGRGSGKIPSQSTLDRLAQALDATLACLKQPTHVAPAVHVSDGPLEQLLAKALERNELSVLYQPVVERTGARTVGVEALARWTRPGNEAITPLVFIPAAERTGLIHEIGEWVLQRACEDFVAWPNLAVAVNVSPFQFGEPDLARRFERIIPEIGFDWRRLELEITESSLLPAEDAARQTMLRLNAYGVTFALDDFGTGYSSLNYLRRFPFGKIKIDRSFVENVENAVEATIVHAVTSIGRSLGMKLVAEGVESAAQQRFLAAAGVHFMQGYLFGPPMPKEEIFDRLRAEAGIRIAATGIKSD